MQHFLPRFFITLLVSFATVFSATAQDTTKPTSVDPQLIELQNAKIPKEYTIGTIKVTGVNYLDTAIVLSISGMQPGDKIMMPGGDAFSKAITKLWRQKLFSNVQVFITDVKNDKIDVEINVQERPKLGNFSFKGIKKSEADELKGKIGLAK